MPATKRKASSKSPRSKKSKDEVESEAPPADDVTVKNENENGTHSEANGSSEFSDGNITEHTNTEQLKKEPASDVPETTPNSSNEPVIDAAAAMAAPVSYKAEPNVSIPTYGTETANSYGIDGTATTTYNAQAAAATNYNPVTNAMYASYDMQYNVTYQNPLTFGAPVAMVQPTTQQIVGNPGEDFSQPPPPPPPPADPEPKPELPQTEISITIEEDHKIYVAPKRRTLLLNEGLLGDIKQALKDSGITILDVQCLRRNHAFLKVSSDADVDKACSTFDDKLISGITWAVKRRIGRAELHMVSFKPSNPLFRIDDEMSQEIMKHVKNCGYHVLRHYLTRDSKEVVIGLETEEEQSDMVNRLEKALIGYIEYNVSIKEDVPPESVDDPDAEPFLFASIRGDDTKFFDGSLVACVKKLLSDENIELKRSNVTANGRFAFFFLAKWDDATKFVEKYDNKIINESPLHFEKGQPRNQREFRPKFHRGGGGGGHQNRGGGGGGNYYDGGFNRQPRGGGGGGYYQGGGGGYNRGGGGGGGGYYSAGGYGTPPPQYGYGQYGYGGGYGGHRGGGGGGGYYNYNYNQGPPRGGGGGYGRW